MNEETAENLDPEHESPETPVEPNDPPSAPVPPPLALLRGSNGAI